MIDAIFIQQTIISILIGALLGLEREHAKKQRNVGLRTFSLISLFGALSVIFSTQIQDTIYLTTLIGFIFVCLFSIGMYYRGNLKKKKQGLTTNISFIITFILGVFIGFNLYSEAIFLAIVITIIQFSRERLHDLVEHLTEKEIGDLLEFLVILGIVYPILPKEMIVYGINLPLFTIWLLVVIISLISFASFIGARHLSSKHEIEVVSFLGGLISGWAATASLIEITKGKRMDNLISGGILLINSANFVRIILILLIIFPALGINLIPTVIISAPIMFFLGVHKMSKIKKSNVKKIVIKSPFNVRKGVELAGIMLVLIVIFDILKTMIPDLFLPITFISAFVSSTAAIATISALSAHETITQNMIKTASLLIILGGLLSNLAIVFILKKGDVIKKAWKEHLLSFIVIILSFYISTLL